MTKQVCIIGAGPSGLPAIKNISEAGISVVAYDYNSDVGGNWIYNEKDSHSSVFETTHIISSKTLSQYEDYPFRPEVSDYPSHEELRNYFQSYAKYFNLYRHIQFNTLVKSCVRLDNGHWEVTTIKDENEHVEIFTDLVVCNGHHWEPKYPNYSGEFTGDFLHSHQYKKAAPFANKKVLVIGGGNSACDVAVETSRVSAKTSISWRRGYRIIPKFLMGKPTDKIKTAGHDKISTFALGQELDQKQWRSVYRQLLALGLVSSDPENYGGLRLLPNCRPLLKGDAQLQLRLDRKVSIKTPKASKARLQIADDDMDLWQLLRELRMALAQDQKVPPYVIFSDSSFFKLPI